MHAAVVACLLGSCVHVGDLGMLAGVRLLSSKFGGNGPRAMLAQVASDRQLWCLGKVTQMLQLLTAGVRVAFGARHGECADAVCSQLSGSVLPHQPAPVMVFRHVAASCWLATRWGARGESLPQYVEPVQAKDGLHPLPKN